MKSEKTGYRIILLLVVGLTAFSSAMKELNQLQQFSLEATNLIAQWSAKFAPAEVPAAPQTVETKQTVAKVAKVETCELMQSLPSVELPWLSTVAPATSPATSPAPRAVVPRPSQVVVNIAKNLPQTTDFHVAKLKKIPQFEFDPSHFDFTITTDGEFDRVVSSELPATQLKAKTRRLREFRINTRDREVFLKSMNRSINLRFAS